MEGFRGDPEDRAREETRMIHDATAGNVNSLVFWHGLC